MMPTMPPGGKAEIHVFEDDAVAVGLAEIRGFDHHVAQSRTGRDLDFQFVGSIFVSSATICS